MSDSEHDQRVYGLYDWISRTLEEKGFSEAGDIVFICLQLLMQMKLGSRDSEPCAWCSVNSYDESFLMDRHDDVGCEQVLRELAELRTLSDDGMEVLQAAESLFAEWQEFEGLWPLLPAILMVLDDCSDNLGYVDCSENSFDIVIETPPCIPCLLTLESFSVAMWHDEERCEHSISRLQA